MLKFKNLSQKTKSKSRMYNKNRRQQATNLTWSFLRKHRRDPQLHLFGLDWLTTKPTQ